MDFEQSRHYPISEAKKYLQVQLQTLPGTNMTYSFRLLISFTHFFILVHSFQLNLQGAPHKRINSDSIFSFFSKNRHDAYKSQFNQRLYPTSLLRGAQCLVPVGVWICKDCIYVIRDGENGWVGRTLPSTRQRRPPSRGTKHPRSSTTQSLLRYSFVDDWLALVFDFQGYLPEKQTQQARQF